MKLTILKLILTSELVFAEDSHSLETKVQNLLTAKCANCHGNSKSRAGGFSFALDSKKMKKQNLVIPGNPLESPLYKRVLDNSMPRGFAQRLNTLEKELIFKWIEAGASDFTTAESEVQKNPVTPISISRLVEQMEVDVQSGPKNESKYFRYFSLLNFYNEGFSKKHRVRVVSALAKMMNSLSWEPRVADVVIVDDEVTLARVNIQKLGWTNEDWKATVRDDPYKLKAGLTRADWFIDQIVRPPHYYRLLKQGSTLAELEKRLGLPRPSKRKIARAGFRNSFISKFNRIIERSPISKMRSYWRSFDFASNEGKQDILKFPLGPSSYGVASENSFEYQGGEILYDLPNGLHGYAVLDKSDKVVEAPPEELILDPVKKSSLTAAISCFSCHGTGLNQNIDFIRPAWAGRNGQLSREILSNYPGSGEIINLMNQDNAQFQKVLNRIGVNAFEPEPIVETVSIFNESGKH